MKAADFHTKFRPMAIMSASLAAALILSLPGLPAQAQDAANTIIDVSSVDSFRAQLDAIKRPSRMDETSDGLPRLEVNYAGLNYRLTFYECEEGGVDCAHVSMSTYADVEDSFPLEKANEWNGDKFLGAFWVDEDGYPWIFQTIDVIGGTTSANFEDMILWWEDYVDAFSTFVSDHESASAPAETNG